MIKNSGISIVTPVYNEEKILRDNREHFRALSETAEIIFVDGGSTDKSVELAKEYGRVLRSKKGRAAQMNSGAGSASGKILLFLHSDAFVFPETVGNIEKALENGFSGGCLRQRIDKKGVLFRTIEGFGNVRARTTKIFYGDQGIFVKKDIFNDIGGFPEVPIMEDVLFSRKLRKTGKTKVLKDKTIVSARRWEQRGVIKTVALYSFINILFYLKVPLNKIKQYCDDLR